ncbi:MAG TPA: DUF2125 domain-containing protein [Stellaceae bacterium]
MRRILIATLVLLAAAAASYTGYWFHVAGRLRAGVEPWAEARRAEGYTVRWDAVSVGGFPGSFSLRFAGAVFGGSRPLPFQIAAPLLSGSARPWNLKRWKVNAPEGARVDAPSEGDAIAAAALDGTVILGTEVGTAIDLVARDVAGSGAAAGLRIADAEARLTLPERAPASHQDTAFGAAIRLAKMVLPYRVPPFGSTVEALTLAGTFKGALPRGKLRQGLAAWRDDGGTIELEVGSLRWGPLAASANGTLALDEVLQPIGAMTATIEGHNAIIDAFVANGSLRPGDASFAKTFLGLMAKPSADGRKQLTVPLRLQNDRVYLGPAQIAALPRFTWD